MKKITSGVTGWGNDINNNFDEIDERVEVLESRANPNLLINSNFKVSELVNQRGENEYTGFWSYAVDVWEIYTREEGHSVSLGNEYLRLKIVDGIYTCLRQKIEKLQLGKVTVSAKIRGTAGEYVDLFINSDRKRVTLTGVWQDISVTSEITSEENNLVAMWFYKISGDSYCDVNYVKLEYGEVATAFVDDDPATKLLKCKRYFQVITYGNELVATDAHAGRRQVVFTFRNSPLRSRPVITLKSDLYLHKTDGSKTFLALEKGFTKVAIATKGYTQLFVDITDTDNLSEIENTTYTANQSDLIGNVVSGYIEIELSAEL